MRHFYFLILLWIFASGCQEDLEPSWLVVDTVNLETNESIEGPNSHAIVDGWVYVNNKFMGVWEIPFRMPVLEEGEHTFLIIPGIKLNGSGSTRASYPFYNSYTSTINLVKGENTTVTPTFSYKPSSKIVAKEDFEDTGVILNPNTAEDSSKFEVISKLDYPDIVKYGNHCGKISLSKLDSLVKVISDLNLQVVQGESYLELDYLSTNSFSVGIISKSSGNVPTDLGPHVVTVKSKEDNFEWKKMYYPLSVQTNLLTFAAFYDFYINAVLDPGLTEGVVYIDNVKIVYF